MTRRELMAGTLAVAAAMAAEPVRALARPAAPTLVSVVYGETILPSMYLDRVHCAATLEAHAMGTWSDGQTAFIGVMEQIWEGADDPDAIAAARRACMERINRQAVKGWGVDLGLAGGAPADAVSPIDCGCQRSSDCDGACRT